MDYQERELVLTFIEACIAREHAERYALVIAHSMGLRNFRRVTVDELYDMTENPNAPELTPEEVSRFTNTDVVVEATNASGETCYVAIESAICCQGRDVERAIRSAATLTRLTGKLAYPVIAGESKESGIDSRIEAGEVFWHELEFDR